MVTVAPSGAPPALLRRAAGDQGFEPPSEASTLPERFFRMAAAHSSRVAVEGLGDRDSPLAPPLTYAELAERVECLAAPIREHVSAGRTVALLFRHGGLWPVGMLAALHAGRAYVPLEPAYPDERLRHVLRDSDAALLLTDGHRDPRATAGTDGPTSPPLINVAPLLSAATETPPGDHTPPTPDTPPDPDALAYVLYTSGTTGGPKGVMQSHRNVLHFIRGYTHNLRLASGDRVLWLASAACDAAVMDIYGALLNGATLVPWRLQEQGLVGLPRMMREQHVTVYHSTPTVYRRLCEALATPEPLPDLRLVVLGGEAMGTADLERFRRHFPRGTVLVNGYGPTEATVVLQEFMDHDTVLPGAVPIGRPVGNLEVLIDPEVLPESPPDADPQVADDQGRRQPVLGELVIRSPHVALGYLNRPAETARAFQGAPTSPDRCYRTGDLGRLLPDGRVVHAGRRDALVKVRGLRIQLEEVEHAIERHPSVRRAGLRTVDHPELGPELLAFVTLIPGQRLSTEALRRDLLRELPAPMVPAKYVVLDAMPLTPSGKLDRRALPAPETTGGGGTDAGPLNRAPHPSDGQTPSTPTERALWALFADVLGRKDFGSDASFFDLGGTSLQALTLFVRIERRLRCALPLALLHRAATVRALASVIDQGLDRTMTSPVVPIQQGHLPPLFMVHGRFGGTLFFRGASINLGPAYTVIGLQPPSLAGTPWAYRTIRAMALDYLAALEQQYTLAGCQLAGVSFGGVVALEMARELEARGTRPRILIIYDTWLPGAPMPRTARPLRARLHAATRWATRLPAAVKYQTAVRVARVWCWGRATVPMRWRPLYIAYWCDRLERAYQPGPYGGDVLLICTPARRAVVEAQWRPLVTGQFTVADSGGRHGDLLSEQNARGLADLLRRVLQGPSRD